MSRLACAPNCRKASTNNFAWGWISDLGPTPKWKCCSATLKTRVEAIATIRAGFEYFAESAQTVQVTVPHITEIVGTFLPLGNEQGRIHRITTGCNSSKRLLRNPALKMCEKSQGGEIYTKDSKLHLGVSAEERRAWKILVTERTWHMVVQSQRRESSRSEDVERT